MHHIILTSLQLVLGVLLVVFFFVVVVVCVCSSLWGYFGVGLLVAFVSLGGLVLFFRFRNKLT